MGCSPWGHTESDGTEQLSTHTLLCWDTHPVLLSMWFKTSLSASPGNLLEMQILKLYPRPTGHNFWGWGPAARVLTDSFLDLVM